VSDEYGLDTSTLVTVYREMPQDIHISLWDAIEELVTDGRLFMPRDAYEELTRVDDGLADWVKRFDGFIVEPTDAEVVTVSEMGARYPGWVDEQKNAADPWLVAHCAEHSRVLVTQERPKGPGTIPKNLQIPNVAVDYNVEYINFNGLARAEGWSF